MNDHLIVVVFEGGEIHKSLSTDEDLSDNFLVELKTESRSLVNRPEPAN
jgi:hypothetical protein